MSTVAEHDRPLQDSETTGVTCHREIPETPRGTQDYSDYDLSPVEASHSLKEPPQGGEIDETEPQCLTESQIASPSVGPAGAENRPVQSFAEDNLHSTERVSDDVDDDEMLFSPAPQTRTGEELVDQADPLESEDMITSASNDIDQQKMVPLPMPDNYDHTFKLETRDTHEQSLNQSLATKETNEMHEPPNIQTTSVHDESLAQQKPNQDVTASALVTADASRYRSLGNTLEAVLGDQTQLNSSLSRMVSDTDIEADRDQQRSATHESHEHFELKAPGPLVDVLVDPSAHITAPSLIERVEDDQIHQEPQNAISDPVAVEPVRDLEHHDIGDSDVAACTKGDIEQSDIKAEGRYSPGTDDAFRATPNVDEARATESFTTSSSTQQSIKHTPAQSRRMAQQSTIDALVVERDELLQTLTSLPGLAEHLSPGVDTSTMDEDTAMAAATSVTQRHIKLLHEYNEIRDVGMGLMGLIADSRGVRIKEVQEEFGIEIKD